MTLPHRRIAKLGLVVLAVFLLFAGWWLMLRPPTADEVARMTAQALSNRDVDALLRLTLPEERDKLHLTKKNVGAMLSNTLYATGLPGKYAVKRTQTYPVDQWQYEFTPTDGDTHGLRYPLPVIITQRPDGKWYLPLGYMLLATSAIGERYQNISDIHRHFWELADRHGIRGVRLNTSGYNMRSASSH